MRKMILVLTMHGIESEGGIVVDEDEKLADDMLVGWDGPSVAMLLEAMATNGHVFLYAAGEIAPAFRTVILTDEPFVEAVRENVSEFVGRPVPRDCPAVREITRTHFEKRFQVLMGAS